MAVKAHIAGRGPLTIAFRCPGCKCAHRVPVSSERQSGRWLFNGNLEAPTFNPSINYTDPGYRCHSFVRDGSIQFLGDCDHALAGQTVELPPWE